MRSGQSTISSRPCRSAFTSSVVSAYTRRREGSPKSGSSESGKPPTKPFTPTMPTSVPATSSTVDSRSSMTMPASRRMATTSSRRLACQSWFPSTATIGGSTPCTAAASASASSGWPCSVRSPASRIRSLSRAASAKTEHDLDFMVRPEDARRALNALEKAGFRVENPPEGWLYKAWNGDVLVDVIFEPTGNPVDDAMFERGEELEAHAISLRAMSLEDVMATKLLAMREHEVDYESVLEIARALREQIDWETVWNDTFESPFARACFYLAEQLGIIERRRASR